ncbi:AAA family ATPase [Roseovarius sp. SK2]|uniref:AAA family ATPase n=1 Tax=Roseovarius TaxID=74030 RepID=UPI00237AA34A|nr:AAA family ATPase [Roseovarius sp. SK2]MDD9727265.1 AAA family ATPase [Roseovarius sp. SK2]
MTHYRAPKPQGLPSKTPLLAAYLRRERAFRGIGKERARALADAFGDDLQAALLAIDDRVIEIIGEEPAIAAAAAMELRVPETGFLSWLDEIGANIDPQKAIRVARAWGPQGIEVVKANPYLLLAVSDFNTVDTIAWSVGIGRKDLRRDIAALEAALTGKSCLGQGSTRMTLGDAQRAAARLLERSVAKTAIDVAVSTGAAVQLAHDLQPPGTAYMEAECALKLMRLAPEPPVKGITPVGRLDGLVDAYEASQPFRLTEAQREAVRMAHRHRLLLLAGYAGSGKTTVLRGVCETLEATGRKPLLVTLSGRAAKRAAEATGRRAITVARFLVEQEKSNMALGPDTVVIADEASMLGLVEIWRILRRLGEASLMLCGDPAQLPPVSPGIVFHQLAGDHDIRKVILDRVHRQDEKTGIPVLAEGIRNGRIPKLRAFTEAEPGITFLHSDRNTLAENILWIGSILKRAGVDRDNVQIIAPTNHEIDRINRFFHTKRLAQNPALWPGQGHIAEGEPVIWTDKNDVDRGLTNGSLGRVKKIMADGVLAELDGDEHFLQIADGANLQLAYAISVHKAQGSQWDKVIVPVFRSKVVDRSLIYTALTRARDQVLFLGDWEAITVAVSRPPSAERRSCGFPDWLTLARRQIGRLPRLSNE